MKNELKTKSAITEADRHIVLYAKGHYKRRENVLLDLKVLLGERSSLSPEHVTENDIMLVLSELIYPYLTRHNFLKIVGDSSPNSFLRHFLPDGEPYNYSEAVSKSMINILRYLDKDQIEIDLGKPDPKILPIRDAYSSEMIPHVHKVNPKTYKNSLEYLEEFGKEHGLLLVINEFTILFKKDLQKKSTNLSILVSPLVKNAFPPLNHPLLKLDFGLQTKSPINYAIIAFARWIKRLKTLGILTVVKKDGDYVLSYEKGVNYAPPIKLKLHTLEDLMTPLYAWLINKKCEISIDLWAIYSSYDISIPFAGSWIGTNLPKRLAIAWETLRGGEVLPNNLWPHPKSPFSTYEHSPLQQQIDDCREILRMNSRYKVKIILGREEQILVEVSAPSNVMIQVYKGNSIADLSIIIDALKSFLKLYIASHKGI